uniref:Uncharacterized protein n=1 Tax=Chromera velia CCMP2878 TaxID=1169474 RepID=A0A0K6SAF9_9ALVE|eukprot:Cvel_9512.t1-p1 / transcript=Cvel_9512.t1 / gene=Cvel_9512 / organism=Chromera_velia_CCMP2878 / gene_product=hypothetical protein / transcript_product=hypothetical protein / location=Cvel_scaffold550:31899-36497(+) / protein_length=690 / sequence_SO=supercontig / SO=protein_coding / is_pseudo=false
MLGFTAVKSLGRSLRPFSSSIPPPYQSPSPYSFARDQMETQGERAAKQTGCFFDPALTRPDISGVGAVLVSAGLPVEVDGHFRAFSAGPCTFHLVDFCPSRPPRPPLTLKVDVEGKEARIILGDGTNMNPPQKITQGDKEDEDQEGNGKGGAASDVLSVEEAAGVAACLRTARLPSPAIPLPVLSQMEPPCPPPISQTTTDDLRPEDVLSAVCERGDLAALRLLSRSGDEENPKSPFGFPQSPLPQFPHGDMLQRGHNALAALRGAARGDSVSTLRWLCEEGEVLLLSVFPDPSVPLSRVAEEAASCGSVGVLQWLILREGGRELLSRVFRITPVSFQGTDRFCWWRRSPPSQRAVDFLRDTGVLKTHEAVYLAAAVDGLCAVPGETLLRSVERETASLTRREGEHLVAMVCASAARGGQVGIVRALLKKLEQGWWGAESDSGSGEMGGPGGGETSVRLRRVVAEGILEGPSPSVVAESLRRCGRGDGGEGEGISIAGLSLSGADFMHAVRSCNLESLEVLKRALGPSVSPSESACEEAARLGSFPCLQWLRCPDGVRGMKTCEKGGDVGGSWGEKEILETEPQTTRATVEGWKEAPWDELTFADSLAAVAEAKRQWFLWSDAEEGGRGVLDRVAIVEWLFRNGCDKDFEQFYVMKDMVTRTDGAFEELRPLLEEWDLAGGGYIPASWGG